MGVTGLWRLIEPAGAPVPVETLENKVLAVDISIWLHQMVKGYQDAKGAPLPNAHLIGLFQRICKLLYFRIKPVFVFDGAFPELKKETINKRQENKLKYNSESERIKRELALLLSKKTAISNILGKQISPKKSSGNTGQNDDLFKLPALPLTVENESESEDEEENGPVIDLHSVDVESESFKNLPVKEKYNLLLDLKDTRKMNSWGKLHELPKKSDNFSDFQMQRLLKRRKVQECLQETEKEMGDCGMSMNDLESLLNEEGIDTKIESLPTRRIAANNTTRYLLINDVKQALAEAKKKKEADQASTSKILEVENSDKPETGVKKDELEEDLEKAIKMSLECVNEADKSACTSKTDDSWTTYDTDYSSDSEEEDGCEPPDMSSAKAYIMQYSDFTDKAINEIVSKSNKINKKKTKKPKINAILEEISKEKTVVLDNVDLSSSDDNDDVEILHSEEKTSSPSIKELDTSIELESQNEESLNETQKSVVCLGTQTDNVISLDSSLDENSFQDTNQDNSEIKKPVSPIQDSDSSDNDFEDVPDIEDSKSKTVCQLTLNVNQAPEDDIFADIFENKKPQDSKIENDDTEMRLGSPRKTDVVEYDEELQLAIKMSLEADTMSEDVNEIHQDSGNKRPENDKSVEKVSTSEKTVKPDAPKISKTQESLSIIQSEQAKQLPPPNNSVASTSKPDKAIEMNIPKEPISTERLNGMVEEIQNEEQNLMQEKGRLDRVGRNITEQMTKEAQELLRMFGIPYIVAPMEAEAQCAFLESVNLTDGTITDDSDIWLFGGKTVYKNFFNQKKHVLQFLAERIEKAFNLNREQLILLALLVGSDYTTGLTGVGPVTALEILASFPFSKRNSTETEKNKYAAIITGLLEFKKWVRSGKRTDNTSLKKKLRNVSVTDDFPSVRVVQAYLEPNIEKSEEKFTWGEIDITILRDYTKAKFGWSQHKLDEIIKPVLKRLVERKTQKTVHDYFKKKSNVDCLDNQMSKRVKAAVQKMGPEAVNEIETGETQGKKEKPGAKRKVKADNTKPGPSKGKKKKTDEEIISNVVRIVSETNETNQSGINIVIPKTDRYQEIIPQREKDKQSLMENKMKAIELFRKTKIDKKRKTVKKKPILPKAEAELSESSDSN